MKLIVDVKVLDLERAVIFYSKILGLTCRVQEKDWAAVVVGDAEIHLYLNGGVVCDVEFYIDDIDIEVSRLASLGVKFLSGIDKPHAISVDQNMITTFPWGRTAFFKDSEENELALVKDLK